MRLILLASLLATPAVAALPVTGHWMTNDRDSIVEIAPCGPKLCGKVVRLLKPVEGGPATDRNNPDPALRTRPLVGLMVLNGFTMRGNDWVGTIYDPRNGKTYRSLLTRNANGTLKVQGCIAFLCKAFPWTPVR